MPQRVRRPAAEAGRHPAQVGRGGLVVGYEGQARRHRQRLARPAHGARDDAVDLRLGVGGDLQPGRLARAAPHAAAGALVGGAAALAARDLAVLAADTPVPTHARPHGLEPLQRDAHAAPVHERVDPRQVGEAHEDVLGDAVGRLLKASHFLLLHREVEALAEDEVGPPRRLALVQLEEDVAAVAVVVGHGDGDLASLGGIDVGIAAAEGLDRGGAGAAPDLQMVVEGGWVERQAVNLALDEADDRAHLREGAIHHAVVLGLAGEPPVDREDDDRVEGGVVELRRREQPAPFALLQALLDEPDAGRPRRDGAGRDGAEAVAPAFDPGPVVLGQEHRAAQAAAADPEVDPQHECVDLGVVQDLEALARLAQLAQQPQERARPEAWDVDCDAVDHVPIAVLVPVEAEPLGPVVADAAEVGDEADPRGERDLDQAQRGRVRIKAVIALAVLVGVTAGVGAVVVEFAI